MKQTNNQKQWDTGKTKNSYAQLPTNRQEHDDIGNFHFHDEALNAANVTCT